MPDSFFAASELEAPAAEVFDWHMRPGAFERLVPPWEPIRIVSRDADLTEGSRVVLEVRAGPVPVRWTAVHRDIVWGRQFCDEQEGGPFRRWRHVHRFVPLTVARTRLEDDIAYELPFGAIGRLAGEALVAGRLRRTFRFRHDTTRGDIEAHWRYRAMGRQTVGVTGASGLIGRHLVPFLTTGGHAVRRFVRGERRSQDDVSWDPHGGIAADGVTPALDAVVHLAGADVAARRWTRLWKRQIGESRVGLTRALAESLARMHTPPRTLLCASDIDIYGHRPGERLTEASRPGQELLSELCAAWEAATRPAEEAGIRVVHLRFGLVLSPSGGLLRRMLPVFLTGAGGPVGDPASVVSWVALDDALGAVLHALATASLRGPLNVSAPQPVSSGDFARTLGHVLRRPALLRVPSSLARLALGELGDAVLRCAQVEPTALGASGYRFRFASLEGALRHGLGRRTGIEPGSFG